MKTWIDWMSRLVGGMLFQGGYVVSPTMVAVGRPTQAAGNAVRETRTDEGARGKVAVAAHACSGY